MVLSSFISDQRILQSDSIIVSETLQATPNQKVVVSRCNLHLMIHAKTKNKTKKLRSFDSFNKY